jgi:hypothetical protein
MPTNHYFNNFPSKYSQEQALVEDLLVEAIKMYGEDCYYIVRESITGSEQDLIFGEDPTAQFNRTYKIEMYMNDVMDHASGGDFMARFGLAINESVTMLISRRTFTRYIPSNIAARPREGDLIYVPFSTNLYEIKHVDHEKNYYTLGRDVKLPYMYEVSCELFRYGQENLVTGVPEIDNIELEGGYAIQLNLNSTSISTNTNYYINETVYQGANLAVSVAHAEVKDWNPITKELRIQNIFGVFSNTGNVTGATSNTTYAISNYDPLADKTNNTFTQGSQIQDESDDIVIETESNPFGSIS